MSPYKCSMLEFTQHAYNLRRQILIFGVLAFFAVSNGKHWSNYGCLLQATMMNLHWLAYSVEKYPVIDFYQSFVFIFNQEATNFSPSCARASDRPQTAIHSISASLETRRVWNSVWISVAEMIHVNWQFFRRDFTVLACPAKTRNYVIKYWIAC